MENVAPGWSLWESAIHELWQVESQIIFMWCGCEPQDVCKHFFTVRELICTLLSVMWILQEPRLFNMVNGPDPDRALVKTWMEYLPDFIWLMVFIEQRLFNISVKKISCERLWVEGQLGPRRWDSSF
jgi:hypothetical protein